MNIIAMKYRREFSKLYLLTSLFIISCLLASPAIKSQEKLYFGVPAVANRQTLENFWLPVLSDLSDSIGAPVEAVFFDDYSGATSAIRDDRIQLAWMGNKHAIETVKNTDSEVFAQVLNVIGVPGYYSLLITQQSRNYENTEDVIKNINSLRFGFGHRNSTSGTTVPLYYLFGKNEIATNDLKSFRYANHEQNFLDVVDGKVDVATVSSIMMQRLKAKYSEKFNQVKVIWSSPLIPSDPLVWSNGLDVTLKNKIKAFFINYGKATPEKSAEKREKEKSNLSRMKYSGFKPSTNKQLQYVRILDLFGKLQAIKTDSNLSSDEKKQRTAEIELEIKNIESGKKAL